MNLTDNCSLPDTGITIKTVWDVMSNKDSAHHVDRQLILLSTYISTTGENIKMVDLQTLSKVLMLIVNRYSEKSPFKNVLQAILELLKRPPIMEKASDELNFKYHLVEMFSTLGCILLQTDDKNLKSQILEIVQRILLTKRTKGSNLTPVSLCIQAIGLSAFMECLADAIATVNEDFYLWTLYTAFQICLRCDLCCWTLLSKDVIESLLIRWTITHERRWELSDITSQLLWKLFSCTSHPDDWQKISPPSTLALSSLRYIHREVGLEKNLPGRDNNMLNNVAAIILKLMHLFPNADYILSGLTEDIAFFSTITEAVIQIELIPYFKTQQEHLQYKKIMLACLALSPISGLSVEIFKFYRIAECLVTMISDRNSFGVEVPWSGEQRVELFSCTLPVILALFDSIYEDFIYAGLMNKLIMSVNCFLHKTEMHLKNVTNKSTEGLLSLCSRPLISKRVHDALRKAGAVPVLLRLCKTTTDSENLTINTQSTLFYCLCTLALLMKNQTDLQEEYTEISLHVVTSVYKRILNPRTEDSLIANRLTIAVSNFAWEAIVLSPKNILKFISSGEIFSQLDILERSSYSVQMVNLSMLVDLCENSKCIPYLVSWRGHKGIKFLSLLCKIWRTEEELLRVPKSADGCISDTERPLMGENQFSFMKKEKKIIISTCDVYGSVRPKIYAVIQLLNRHKEVTELCEEHYKIGYNKLPYEDHLTLRLAEAYLPLKLGEIWWEIRLKQENAMPLDRYLVQTLADKYIHWSLSVKLAQQEILRDHKTKLREEEYSYYNLMHSDRLTSALEAFRQVVAIARSSDRQMQQLLYERLLNKIEDSREGIPRSFKSAFTSDNKLISINSKADIVLEQNGTVEQNLKQKSKISFISKGTLPINNGN